MNSKEVVIDTNFFMVPFQFNVDVTLKLPVCASPGDRVALSRRVGARWRLIGYGIIK